MDLALSEDQRLVAETAADFLTSACDSQSVRTVSVSEDGFDRSLWRQIIELGWCGVQVPEAEGGLGWGWVELVLLQEQLGRRLACVPYFDSIVLAATLLRACGDAGQSRLARVSTGESVATTALEPGNARVRARGDGWQLDGAWPQLETAGWADSLLLTALDADAAPVVLAVPAEKLSIRPLRSIDTIRQQAAVRAEAVALPATACLLHGAAALDALRQTRDLGAIALAAEQLGVAQQCLDISVAYVAQRVQFGQPVGRFQAVKHRCARMAVKIETARSAVYGAAAVADADPDAATLAFHAAQAITAANDAARYCTQEAIQLHGGMGYTWECDAQLYFKRAQAASQRLGTSGWWCERTAAQLLDTES